MFVREGPAEDCLHIISVHQLWTDGGLVALALAGIWLSHTGISAEARYNISKTTHMQTEVVRSGKLFVGVDVHKDTHTAVGLTPFGEKVFEMTISNETDDFELLVEKAQEEAAAS